MMNTFPSDIQCPCSPPTLHVQRGCCGRQLRWDGKNPPFQPGQHRGRNNFQPPPHVRVKSGGCSPPACVTIPRTRPSERRPLTSSSASLTYKRGSCLCIQSQCSVEPETGPCNLVEKSQSRTGQPSVLRRGSAARVCTLSACRSVTVLSHGQEAVRRTDSNCHCKFVFGCLRGRSSFPLRGGGGGCGPREGRLGGVGEKTSEAMTE